MLFRSESKIVLNLFSRSNQLGVEQPVEQVKSPNSNLKGVWWKQVAEGCGQYYATKTSRLINFQSATVTKG